MRTHRYTYARWKDCGGKGWAAFDPTFEPLTRRVYRAFGWLPIPGDEHLCEYLPWVSDPLTKPWEKYEISLYDWDLMENVRDFSHDDVAKTGEGKRSIAHLRDADSEGAPEMIEDIAGVSNHYHLAVNLPNQRYITNLPGGDTEYGSQQNVVTPTNAGRP